MQGDGRPGTGGEPFERRLATILMADIVGYSRMMEANEERTLRVFRGHREIFDAMLVQHRGRMFNTAGDAVLAEFPSAVDAVRCATEIQSALRTRNDHLAPEERMQFRIGVNLGDVIVQGTDLLGDGVNVAARIQTAAEPGGVCVSGSVYDQIRNKLSLEFHSMGERTFKNITQPVRVFSIGDEAGEAAQAPATKASPSTPPTAPAAPRSRPVAAIAAVVAALAVAAAAGWWYVQDRETKAAEAARAAEATKAAEALAAAEAARRRAEEQAASRIASEREARLKAELEATQREAAEAKKREAAARVAAAPSSRAPAPTASPPAASLPSAPPGRGAGGRASSRRPARPGQGKLRERRALPRPGVLAAARIGEGSAVLVARARDRQAQDRRELGRSLRRRQAELDSRPGLGDRHCHGAVRGLRRQGQIGDERARRPGRRRPTVVLRRAEQWRADRRFRDPCPLASPRNDSAHGVPPLHDPVDPQRRGLLALALAAGVAPAFVACALLRTWKSDPFALGVASGCPRPDSVVLWTRLAPAAEPGAREQVGWELATDEGFRNVVRRGTEVVDADVAHSVHVQASGLEPSRWYWYRFTAGGERERDRAHAHRAGAGARGGARVRDRVLPALRRRPLRGMAPPGRRGARPRRVPRRLHLRERAAQGPRAHALRQRRGEDARRLPRPLRAVQVGRRPAGASTHAAPWIITWDDHEVQNDYANDRGQDLGAGLPRAARRRVPRVVGAHADAAVDAAARSGHAHLRPLRLGRARALPRARRPPVPRRPGLPAAAAAAARRR